MHFRWRFKSLVNTRDLTPESTLVTGDLGVICPPKFRPYDFSLAKRLIRAPLVEFTTDDSKTLKLQQS